MRGREVRALRGVLGPSPRARGYRARRARFAFLHAVALVHRGRSLAALERANAMGFPFGLKAWVVSAVPNALIRPLPSLRCWPTLIDRRDNYRLGLHI